VGTASALSVALEPDETQSLLMVVPRVYGTRPDEVLLTALGLALADWTGSRRLRLDLEGHGREELFDGIDLSRTVGWFTTIYPVLLDLEGVEEPGAVLRAVKEQARQIPQSGMGYGVLSYLQGGNRERWASGSEVIFNYLGRLDASLSVSSPFRSAPEPIGPSRSPRQLRPYALEINGGVIGGRLETSWIYSPNLHARSTVERVAALFLRSLRELIAHCLSSGAGSHTPSDFNRVRLTQERLDNIVAELDLG
jgi:non-ribosomal peptide synthase protein (TIGR01720 family)